MSVFSKTSEIVFGVEMKYERRKDAALPDAFKDTDGVGSILHID